MGRRRVGETCLGVPKMGFSTKSTPQHFSQGPMATSSEKENVSEKANDMPSAAYKGICKVDRVSDPRCRGTERAKDVRRVKQ